jgi:hypothetical protein
MAARSQHWYQLTRTQRLSRDNAEVVRYSVNSVDLFDHAVSQPPRLALWRGPVDRGRVH